ncbi:MAG: gfo/Idh/MocA family oxidoreductase, partial [Spirochaetia bacterium]
MICRFNGSWGVAFAGLRECYVQSDALTPRPVWEPDIESSIDYFADWKMMPTPDDAGNAFKAQWELFLLHVAADEAFPWTLLEGAKGVQLAEIG